MGGIGADWMTVTPAVRPTALTGKAVGASLPHPLRNGGLFLAVAVSW